MDARAERKNQEAAQEQPVQEQFTKHPIPFNTFSMGTFLLIRSTSSFKGGSIWMIGN